MPSIKHCVTKTGDMTTFTNSLEVFGTYNTPEDDKDSDEESFHLPIDDDECESKELSNPDSNLLEHTSQETEDDILNKYESTTQKENRITANNVTGKLDCDSSQSDVNSVKETKSDTAEKKVESSSTSRSFEDVESQKSSAVEDRNKDGKDEAEESSTKEDRNKEKCDLEEKTKLDEQESGIVRETPIADSDAKKDVQPSENAAASAEDKGSDPTKTPEINASESNSESSFEAMEVQASTDKESGNIKKESETQATDKGENSNDSDDLMDVCVIRDAAEDNAEIAYNEAHPEESEDGDNASDKVEAGDDDNSHTDEVDIEEPSVRQDPSDLDCDTTIVQEDTIVQGNTSDVQIEEHNTIEKNEVDVGKCESGSTNKHGYAPSEAELEPVDVASDVDKDKRLSLKRTLESDSENDDMRSKRCKSTAENVEPVKTEPHVLESLSSLAQFMKKKKLGLLSIYDLEQFCIQKVCEAIVYKNQMGDVHHQLKLQGQLIDTMKKDIQVLTKQAKDLEIVNKKLLNDLKQHNVTQKPLLPLKITRSVGLQVKLPANYEVAIGKRRIPVMPHQPIKAPNKIQKTSPVTPTTTPRQVQISQLQKVQSSPVTKAAATPILSHALQTRKVDIAANSRALRTKTAEAKSLSVIDLTDEDDKRTAPQTRAVSLRTAPVKQVNGTTGLRLTTTQSKGVPISSVVTNSTSPHLMYVVQSPSNGMGSKALLVNFQPNTVLASSLNGSPVSVIPKQNSGIQMKTTTQPKGAQAKQVVKTATKHPAALPSPPFIKVVNERLKSIPPKPYLTIRKTETGIILQWRMPYDLDMYEVIASYQLYAYQETNALPSTDMWRRVGDVKALALPMACTLTQFADKNKYYFAVRPVDIHKRIGAFSDPEEICL